MTERALQANEEEDSVYQDDHTCSSGLQLDYDTDVSCHSLTNPHIIEEVDMEELHAPPSNQHEEMFS